MHPDFHAIKISPSVVHYLITRARRQMYACDGSLTDVETKVGNRLGNDPAMRVLKKRLGEAVSDVGFDKSRLEGKCKSFILWI